MYILVNRKTLQIICKFEAMGALLPEHHSYPYVTVDLVQVPDFRQFTELELKLLYRNTGSVKDTNIAIRDSVVIALHKLISHKLVGNPAQEALFAAEPEAIQAPTGEDRPITNTSALVGNKAIIWEIADTMWEAAGKPFDKPVVLALRKTMMNELEFTHGIKKTSSSNELGSWMKTRVP